MDNPFDLAKKIVEDECGIYRDAYDRNVLYAEFKKADGTVYCTEIEALDFAAFLRMRFKEKHPTLLPPKTESVIEWLHDYNSYFGNIPTVEPCRRKSGSLAKGVEYALYDDEQKIVGISAKGWDYTDEPKTTFLTSSTDVPQSEPERSNGDLLSALKPFINMDKDYFLLFVIWLVQAFCGGHHYIALLEALAGSGKSFLTRMVCELIDPSAQQGMSMPKNLEDLQTVLAATYLTCFDNLGALNKEQSDTLCMAITSGLVQKRKRFTDKTVVRLKLHNTVLMNGVDVMPEQSDLATRCLLFKMPSLPDDKIEDEAELWANFVEAKPVILGLIFNTIFKAMSLYDAERKMARPRLADAFTEMVFISEALGVSEEEFRRVYNISVNTLQKRRANTPIIEAVREYMTAFKGRKYSDSATNVYNTIRSNYSGEKSLLPKRAAEFSKRLENETAALKSAGFRVLVDDTGASGSVITIIKKK